MRRSKIVIIFKECLINKNPGTSDVILFHISRLPTPNTHTLTLFGITLKDLAMVVYFTLWSMLVGYSAAFGSIYPVVIHIFGTQTELLNTFCSKHKTQSKTNKTVLLVRKPEPNTSQ